MNELRCHFPVGFAGPGLLQDKNRQAVMTLHLTLSPLLLSKAVAGNDGPSGATFLAKRRQPLQIRCARLELICQGHHFTHLPRFKAVIA